MDVTNTNTNYSTLAEIEVTLPKGCGSPDLWILLRMLFCSTLLMHANSYCVVKTVG